MKLLCPALAFLFFISINSCSEKESGPGKIQGILSNASEITVYLQSVSDAGEKTIDSAITDSNGKFEMKNSITQLDYYMFRTDPTNMVFLILQGGENVEITGDATKLDQSYEVKGSNDSKLIRDLKHFEKNLGDSLNQIYIAIRNESPDQAEIAGSNLQNYYTSSMQTYSENFVNDNLKSLASLSATKYLDKNSNLDLMESLGQSLNETYPNNKYITDYMALLAELRKLPIGSVAPEISLPSPDGKTISLSSLRGKIVLIDFWASWCGPCRKENPFIVSIYNKYKSQGFDIYAVSLDDNTEAWNEAIKKDGLTWHQVGELKKWDSQIARTYGVEAIPFSVLLDKEGKIIGKGLRGAELEAKIRTALGINS